MEQRQQDILGPPLNALSQGYRAIATGMQQLYQNSPKAIKHVALPMAATAAASQIPGVESAISTLTHQGGEWISQIAGDWVNGSLDQWGDQFTYHLQQAAAKPVNPQANPFMRGIQAIGHGVAQTQLNGFNWVGTETKPLMVAASQTFAQVAGRAATTMAIGETIIQAKALANIPIKAIIARSQAAIDKAKNWLVSAKNKVENLIGRTLNMSQNNGHNPNQDNEWPILSPPPSIGRNRQDTELHNQNPGLPPPPPLMGGRNEQAPPTDNDPWSLDDGPGLPPPPPPIDNDYSPNPFPDDEPEEGFDYGFEPDDEQPENTPIAADELDEGKKQKTSKGEEIDPADVAQELATLLATRGLDTQNFKILVQGQEVYKLGGGDVLKNDVSPDVAKMINQALTDPQSLEGSVVIKQGSKVLLHVQDGKIITDTLGIAKQAAQAIVDPTANLALYEKAKDGVSRDDLKGTEQIAANALKMGAETETVRDMLKGHDENIKQVEAKEGDKAADATIDRVMKGAQKIVNAQQKAATPSNKKAPALRH